VSKGDVRPGLWARRSRSLSVSELAARYGAQPEAGASQVAVQPLEEGDPFGRETFRRLPPILLDRPPSRTAAVSSTPAT
jgi:hypothetical protein